MSEQEFEQYLKLLRKMMRLGPEESCEIADELCDHMEQRFAELCGQGILRDDAVAKVLDEFEDAATQASRFREVATRRKRARLVKSASVAAACLVIGVLIGSWMLGSHGNTDNPEVVIAQELSKEHEEPSHDPGELRFVATDDVLPSTLVQPVSIDLVDTPLIEAMAAVEAETGIVCRLHASLEDSGISGNSTVSIQADDVPLYLVMERMLRYVEGVPLAATWVRGQFVISTGSFAESTGAMSVETYDLRRLLEQGYTRPFLQSVMQSKIDGNWFTADGVGGSISNFDNLLLVRQTPRAHGDIRRLLRALDDPGGVTYLLRSSAEIDGIRAMDQVVAFDFIETPLDEVAAFLTATLGIEISLDAPILEGAGLSGESLLTLRSKGQSLRAAFDMAAVEGVPVTFIPIEGRVVLTTQDFAESEEAYLTVLFEARDLVRNGSLEQIRSLVLGHVGGFWFDVDAFGGTIDVIPNQDVFLVRQSESVIHDIRELLATIRERSIPCETTPTDPAEIVAKVYRVSQASADSLMTAIPENVAPDQWAAEAIGANAMSSVVFSEVTTMKTPTESIDGELVLENVPDARSFARMSSVTWPPHTALMVRQRRDVHDQIEVFLTQLGVLVSPESNSGEGMQHGFGGSSGSGFFSISGKM